MVGLGHEILWITGLCSQELPESLDDLLLPLSHEVAADMYVIGTQESSPSRLVVNSSKEFVELARK